MLKQRDQGVQSFHEYRQKLQAHAERAIAFFSDGNRSERERAVCRAFLRCIGVPFDESEIVAPTTEPADVSFRDALFQVREILNTGSRRHGEWKARRARAKGARSISDVDISWDSPIPMPLRELADNVAEALRTKSRKYGKVQCAALDALVYVDLTQTRFLAPGSDHADVTALEEQGWRSVLVVFPPYGLALSPRNEAPPFLRSLVGIPRTEWTDLHVLFNAPRGI